jgi:hypothetical protein
LREEENPMSFTTPPTPVLPGDFAAGERTETPGPEEAREASLQGDFAANERTETPTPDEVREEGLHGDFAGGERKEPLTAVDDTPGTFADTKA